MLAGLLEEARPERVVPFSEAYHTRPRRQPQAIGKHFGGLEDQVRPCLLLGGQRLDLAQHVDQFGGKWKLPVFQLRFEPVKGIGEGGEALQDAASAKQGQAHAQAGARVVSAMRPHCSAAAMAPVQSDTCSAAVTR